MIDIDKGDYLTFASIGSAVGLKIPFDKCEIDLGVWRRHWELKDHESRSDISRDGYLGLLLYGLLEDYRVIQRIKYAGWKRRWTMGERGEVGYINIWPLVPLIYNWPIRIPLLAAGSNLTGFRAHLLALAIMVEYAQGRNTRLNRWSIERLVKYNPGNVWFVALYSKLYNINFCIDNDYQFNMTTGGYGWGSCPGEVYKALTLYTCSRL